MLQCKCKVASHRRREWTAWKQKNKVFLHRLAKADSVAVDNTANGLKFEVELRYRRPVEVIARDIHSNDYIKGFEHILWHGPKRIRDVTGAIFRIARCNNGAEMRVAKGLQVLSYDEFLEDLCVPHRQMVLSIVINQSNQ